MSEPDLFVRILNSYIHENGQEVNSSFDTDVISDSYQTGRIFMEGTTSALNPFSDLNFCSMHPLSKRVIYISIYDQDLSSPNDLIDQFELTLSHQGISQKSTYSIKGKNSKIKLSIRLKQWQSIVEEYERYIQSVYDRYNEGDSAESNTPWGNLSLQKVELHDGRAWTFESRRVHPNHFKLEVECMHSLNDLVVRLDDSCSHKGPLRIRILDDEGTLIEKLTSPHLTYRSFDQTREINVSVGSQVKSLIIRQERIKMRMLLARITRSNLTHYSIGLERVSQGVKVISIKLNDKLQPEVIKRSPVYRIPIGQEKIIQDTLRFSRKKSLSVSRSLETESKINFHYAELGIKGRLEKIYSKEFTEEREFMR